MFQFQIWSDSQQLVRKQRKTTRLALSTLQVKPLMLTCYVLLGKWENMQARISQNVKSVFSSTKSRFQLPGKSEKKISSAQTRLVKVEVACKIAVLKKVSTIISCTVFQLQVQRLSELYHIPPQKKGQHFLFCASINPLRHNTHW